MAIDNIKIGERIRIIREEDFRESRETFAEHLNISAGYLGKVERGEIQISIKLLEKITKFASVSSDYILFGNNKDKMSYARKNINFILDNSNEDALKAYSKILMTVQGYGYKIAENQQFLCSSTK